MRRLRTLALVALAALAFANTPRMTGSAGQGNGAVILGAIVVAALGLVVFAILRRRARDED